MRSGWRFGLLLLWTLLNGGQPQLGLPRATPFFFLCNIHGNIEELGQQTQEVKLSVAIKGNPDTYVPGNFYQVTVSSSKNFDGFFLTGLYTITNAALNQIQAMGVQATAPVGQNHMCSIVHSHLSEEPVHEFQFVWLAPPSGTGCVSFMATATLKQQTLFKDTPVLQLCEEGAPTPFPLRPTVANLHTESFIFRDDFDTFESFEEDIWSSHEGVSVGRTCGSINYGNAAVFCEKSGNRKLITNPLNTTTAAVLHFVVGVGTCSPTKADQDITVSFGLNNCQDWFMLDRFRPPTGKDPHHILVHLPSKARGVGVCIAFKQAPTTANSANLYGLNLPGGLHSRQSAQVYGEVDSNDTDSDPSPLSSSYYGYHHSYDGYQPVDVNDDPYAGYDRDGNPLLTAKKGYKTKTHSSKTSKFAYNIGTREDSDEVEELSEAGTGNYQGCWGIDEVVIVNMADMPVMLQDGFDPVDTGKWLASPGAYFKAQCRSQNTAMVFNHESRVSGVSTRDFDLSAVNPQADLILEQQFESKTQPGWRVSGGHVDVTCGEVHEANSMVFTGPGKSRKLCSPFIETGKAGNVRFHFALGAGVCNSSDLAKAGVLVYLEDENEHTLYIAETLGVKSYKEPQLVSIPLKPLEKNQRARICWLQKFSGGENQNVWAIDNVQVLPYLPTRSPQDKEKMAQYSLNLQCGNNPDNNKVDVLYSTNYGESWHKLRQPCIPGQCDADYLPAETSYTGNVYDRWRRVTVALPYASLVPHVRFRWIKTSQDDPNWAIDTVYIGNCYEGCNGHGYCKEGACECDFPYVGPTCAEAVSPKPNQLVENFDGTIHLGPGVAHVSGGNLGYECDVLSSGKALVFNGDGRRELVTGELNTTDNMYLQFNIRVGSFSQVSDCPAPDQGKELVILDYSCNGGMTWHLLKTFNTLDFRKPLSDSVVLPEGAQGDGCMFRWWQPTHSGHGQDVWALDDISLNDHLFNTLHIHMDNMVDIGETITITHGQLSDTYCRKMKSLSFLGPKKPGDLRFLETESMLIGPGYIMEFDLVMGCGLPYVEGIDNRLYLEYSIDHGIHWNLVIDPCLPPSACNAVHQGTIYDWTQYRKWTRVTVPLPHTTMGPATRFRIRQSNWMNEDTWGVARLYIGQQCLDMCSGHGECNDGLCVCDEGYEGKNCHSSTNLDDKMQADFGIRYEPDTDFDKILGGKVVSNNRGCGNIHSDESLYFFDDGIRELITKDLDTHKSDYMTFYLRIGGGDEDCNGGELRSEGIIFQYSTDGGITWNMLDELLGSNYGNSRLVYHELPEESKTHQTRFRWWQPSHGGKGHDQWAIDEIFLGPYENLRSLEDDFDNSVEALDSDQWLAAAGGVIGKYCNSRQPVLILANQEVDKRVITKDMKLNVGDVIQFKINVGCTNQFRWDHPVFLQYWPRGGSGFRLVQEGCYQEMECDGDYKEASIYYSGPHGHWQLIVIPVTEELAKYPVILRWWQPGGYPFNFALDDVYIGPPCDDNCHRKGACKNSRCSCYENFEDPNCQSDDPTPYGMVDRFEQLHRPSDFWQRIYGGHLGLGCGTVDTGNALFFDGLGTREAVTVPLNTTYLRILEFVLKIGATNGGHRCTQPTTPNEGIIVDYSTDNEITWKKVKTVEPILYNGTTERVILELPPSAKSERTIFRWWQPLGYGGMRRAEWGLDSVTLGVNDTNLEGFQDDFAGMMPDMFTWYQTESAIPRITCNSKGNALEFSRIGASRYAETWDYHVTPSTFLQFDIAMGCDSLYDTLYGVMLEYSTNMGKNWEPVVTECAPPNFECSGYHLESDYMSEQHRNWTRISVYLPHGALSPATRFRWKQHSMTPSGNVWALDNVYLGNGCPWLCSGHGYCNKGTCVCDEGYTGEHCVPSKPLPMMLRDDFNQEKPLSDNWQEVYGGGLTTVCGIVVSGNALTFSQDHLRMAVTRDLDTTMINTIEFYFLYGCNGERMDWPRTESVLLQYSSNGGITWHLLKEMHYRNESGPRFFSLELPMRAKHNSTRFRFWQPVNAGKMRSTWAVDNLFIGRMTMNPSMMQDDFSIGLESDSWLFVNDGEVGTYCDRNVRDDTLNAGGSALVFKHGPKKKGEHSVVTRDLDVGPMSILQFDINVGCASEATHKYPIRLEYSFDGGKTWNLVVPNCADVSSAICHDNILPTTMYYGGTSKYWRRIVIPLENLHVCGSLRFRWYQGVIPEYDFGPEWAIDNIFIGMGCMQHCLGKGDCGDTMMCSCDPAYDGDFCTPTRSYPNYMKEGFPLGDSSDQVLSILPVLDSFINPDRVLDEEKWSIWGGARISRECGLLVDGHGLMFHNTGERTLVTTNLDLSKATTVQFYLRLGCGDTPPDPATPPVYAQYTTNSGINWHTIEQFDFNSRSNQPFYVALNLPELARSPASQLRWWQPSMDGQYMEDWAIDQIYIGGDYDGVPMLADEPAGPRDPSWTMNPGGSIEEECASDFKAIKLQGNERHRFAVTADVTVSDATFLQFNLAMGCAHPKSCYSIDLEYSEDLGITWKPVWEACLPSNVDCNKFFYDASTFYSDVNWGWNRYSVPLPYYTKSIATRFRWYQKEGYNHRDTWAVANLFVGTNQCPNMCSGHGKCTEEGCVCDEEWAGPSCGMAVNPLSTFVYDMFSTETNDWAKIAGGRREKVCQTLSSGEALHFTGNCTRKLISKPLDLSSASFVQFYFMFGCYSSPDNVDESVLINYSPDGVYWSNFGMMHYLNYKNPSFVTLKLPEGARTNVSQIMFVQLKHSGTNLDDWMIDNLRIGGNQNNPEILVSDFSTGVIDPEEWNTFDNMQADDYCGIADVAVGEAKDDESATLTTRDLNIKEGHMLQFWYNIGCMRPWNATVAPVHLQYSTDNGMTWMYVYPQCLSNDPECPEGAIMGSVYYGDPMGRWRRITIPLAGLVVSKASRFRWQQRQLQDEEAITEFGIKGVYIGPGCEDFCGGHGNCNPESYPACQCDAGYSGENCYPQSVNNPSEMKDVFNDKEIDKSKWSLVQSGSIQDACSKLVEATALVHNGPGMRQAVTVDMDLRDAKFVQYTAMIGGETRQPGCFKPYSDDQSVILQYSNDGGIHWYTLHTLDYTSYLKPHRDYIPLPQEARTPSTRIRWWQPIPHDPSRVQPTWAIDDVYIGGHEINPAKFDINFNETLEISDQPWEFNPYGHIEVEVCKKEDSVITWEQGTGLRHLTTKQMIVQKDYILQFKIAVGCSQKFNICMPLVPVQLLFNKNPSTDDWYDVTPLCLPDLNPRMDCLPNMFHSASHYTPDAYPVWTRVTIRLPEKTYSSTTRFKWVQDAPDTEAAGWALDDIYVGENCPEMCHGRGDCKGGQCQCDEGYKGPSCMPAQKRINRMFESFEGGIYTSHWDRVTGGGIGFGCGALLPYAHGKTLYFNGCALREARTVEMDLTRASKIVFVLQIGCEAQTAECNVKISEESQYRGILLQYTLNKGSEWHIVARHDPADHLKPKRVKYDIPEAAKVQGVQFRWWQPVHGGEGFDQWAIDHVEFVPGLARFRYYGRRRRHLKRF